MDTKKHEVREWGEFFVLDEFPTAKVKRLVIKKDKNRELYDCSKIEAGIVRSCHKRAVSMEAIEQALDDIETRIFNLELKEIESSQIGEIVMERLKKLDGVAYVRFASVYREFKDVSTFMDELKKVLNSDGEKEEEE